MCTAYCSNDGGGVGLLERRGQAMPLKTPRANLVPGHLHHYYPASLLGGGKHSALWMNCRALMPVRARPAINISALVEKAAREP
jgi:hypothetical protein